MLRNVGTRYSTAWVAGRNLRTPSTALGILGQSILRAKTSVRSVSASRLSFPFQSRGRMLERKKKKHKQTKTKQQQEKEQNSQIYTELALVFSPIEFFI